MYYELRDGKRVWLDHSPHPPAVEARIRRLARRQKLVAQRSRRDGKWYFANHDNWLQSPETGLSEAEALEFLLEQELDAGYVAAMDAVVTEEAPGRARRR